jgi:hypothetical protein
VLARVHVVRRALHERVRLRFGVSPTAGEFERPVSVGGSLVAVAGDPQAARKLDGDFCRSVGVCARLQLPDGRLKQVGPGSLAAELGPTALTNSQTRSGSVSGHSSSAGT